jgi:RNA polymerase sigma factor (sigma-70 family)
VTDPTRIGGGARPARAAEDAALDPRIEDLLRDLAPQVLGILAHRHGRFDACEDAVQEALLAAATRWPVDGVPDNPRGWLLTVASRRLTDELRAEQARQRRETDAAWRTLPEESLAPDPADIDDPNADDSLTLLFLCCHPELSAPSQIALTLRAFGGLTTAEIARAWFVPEATMAQRISRAKARIKATGARFTLPPPEERAARLQAVLHVLYLVFNEGYAATSGRALQRAELTDEAIRLTRTLQRTLPTDGEVAGLLALMLFTDARRVARTTPDGGLVALADQDRRLWDQAMIAEGVSIVTRTLGRGPVGPYQIQAAISAIHDEATTADTTDWPQILAFYQMLERVSPGPAVTLNHAVAVAMVHGPMPALAMLGTLDSDERMAGNHRVDAVRAHLLEMAGDQAGARDAYLSAARRTQSVPEQRYLTDRAARLVARPD